MNIDSIARVTIKTLVLPLLLLVSTSAFAINPPNNPRAVVQSSTKIQWEWDWVSDAAKYEVYVDGQYRGETVNPWFISDNLWPGEHSMSVKSIDWNGQYSGPSATIKTNSANFNNNNTSGDQTQSRSSERSASSSANVATPANLSAREVEQSTVQWQWDWTPGAVNYEVTIDGASVGTTNDTQYYSQNLWAGEHSLTVRAINDAGQYSESSETLKINVSAHFNSAAAAPPPPAQNDPVANNNPVPSTDTGRIDPASYNYSEVYEKEGYELSFSDEFNNSNLNRSRWNTQLRWDGEFNGVRQEYRVINGERQFYVNIFSDDQDHQDYVVPQHNPFELNGSRLAIRAIRNPLKKTNNRNGHGPLRSMVEQQDFLSGAISTYDKFTQKYGYFEARIKIPSHVGTFPAFWLHHQKRKYEGTRRTEIDIMENLGHAPWYIYNSFHYFNNVSATYGGDAQFVKPQPEGQIYTGTDYSQDYHTYAVEWEPGHVTWFIDGQKVSELYNDNVDYEDLYLILNMAIGGFWTNYPASSGGLGRNSSEYFPNQNDLNTFSNPALEIDYVRVYKRK